MANDQAHADIARMSFEAALAELETIVARLERGEAKLDEAIGDYERGAALRRHCETRLREAQEKVDKIRLGPDGVIGVEQAAIEQN